jgi:hypothetical protein
MKVQAKSSVIDRIIAEYQHVAAQNKVSDWIVTASTLILLKTIPNAGVSFIQFGVLTSDQPILPTEVRLNINDEFVIVESSLCLYGLIGTTTGPATVTSNRYWTYAPYQVGKVFIALMPFWDSGMFNLLINSTQIIKNMDTNQFNVVPRTQEGGFVTPTNSNQGNADWSENGYIEMSPTITLSGAKTNVPTLTFQGGTVTPVINFELIADDASTIFFNINTAAWINRGVLAQNAAQFQGSQQAPDGGGVRKMKSGS